MPGSGDSREVASFGRVRLSSDQSFWRRLASDDSGRAGISQRDTLVEITRLREKIDFGPDSPRWVTIAPERSRFEQGIGSYREFKKAGGASYRELSGLE
jgi:hypothetical protein